MKTNNLAKKALVMVAMTLMFVMDSNAQQKRMMEFQMLMAMNETTYFIYCFYFLTLQRY